MTLTPREKPTDAQRERLKLDTNIAVTNAGLGAITQAQAGKIADALLAAGYLHRDDAMEAVAKWHERRAAEEMGGLCCGSPNEEYRLAHVRADYHIASAAALRQRTREVGK